MKKLLIMILITISIPVLSSVKVVEEKGTVQINRRRSNKWINASAGDKINIGDRIRTLAKANVTLRLRDDSILRLDSETLIYRTARDNYNINGLATLKATNLRTSTKFNFLESHFEFEDGEFTITASSNMIWAVSHGGEFWAEGPDGRTRVLSDYQTIITYEKGPIEPEPSSAQKTSVLSKADLKPPERLVERRREQIEKSRSFFMRFKNFKICNIDVEEKQVLYINRDDLIRNKMIITGEIDDTQAQDIETIRISLDGGETYNEAEGVSPFRYEHTPQPRDKYVLRVVGRDASGGVSGQNFINVEINFINETDQQQIKRYMSDFVNFIEREQYGGVMSYFNESDYLGDLGGFTQNIIDYFYYYDYFYIRYDIRSILPFGRGIEVAVDWETDVTVTDSGKTKKEEGFTLFQFEKNDENRWRIRDILEGTLFGIPVMPGASIKPD
ncbi:MAG: hypothetical protein ACQESP_06980 [Candidatus Muiribacteriota bacterium]